MRGQPIASVTGLGSIQRYELPYTYPNGTSVWLGDAGLGYPPDLYPNFTYPADPEAMTVSYDGKELGPESTLLLGPLYIGNNVTLISMTVPVLNNTSRSDLLGWTTIVLDARNIYAIIHSSVALGRTGDVVILGSRSNDNLFAQDPRTLPESIDPATAIRSIAPPYSDRHPGRNANLSLPDAMDQYMPILDAWSPTKNSSQNEGYAMNLRNEYHRIISVGYAWVDSPIVDWVVVFGQTKYEVMGPIRSLQDTILACVFSVLGAILVVCFPLAHYAAKPIQALRSATENSVTSYEVIITPSILSDSTEKSLLSWKSSEKGFMKKTSRKPTMIARKTRSFQIPQRVPDRRHFIHDELTDLTEKFNDMADELSVQYSRLEDRVKVRTIELERSRNEAQAANESKTLFIANVSHELRTPLNGIIGMCAVAMQEDRVSRIRQSLKIIYKSSDLLLHLLNDLLTFSRSSYGQKLAIEENTFRLIDVGSQLVSIFQKQARDADVGLKVVFLGPSSTYPNSEHEPEDAIVATRDIGGNLRKVGSNILARGPADTGPLREIGLRGDKNRILQILMNLVSNSLKFTPAKGQVEVRIRCKEMIDLPLTHNASNADTLVDPMETPSIEIPTISVRKPSVANITTNWDFPRKALSFDFEVEDTGPGIPEHLQQEIFKPFVQGDVTLSKKHGGTGLGLAICSQLAETMGGSIKLKSTVDIGSTFTLSLPLRYTKEKVPSVSGSLARSGRRASLSSSVQFDGFSARSGNSNHPRTQPHSARTSMSSPDRATVTSGLEAPRIVGYSQPFILDGNDSQTDEDKRPPSSRRPRQRPGRPPLESIESTTSMPVVRTISMSVEPVSEMVNEVLSEQPTSHPPISAESVIPALRVLVAEDNQVNQQVILRLLKLEKVPDSSVTLAEDGLQALDAVQHSLADPTTPPFTLVFMDIQMPRMDGIEATKQIRALGFAAPIIALTAFDHESNRVNCKEASMNAFLPKPIKRTALKKVLADYRPTVDGWAAMANESDCKAAQAQANGSGHTTPEDEITPAP